MEFSHKQHFFKHLLGLTVGSALLLAVVGFFWQPNEVRAVNRTWDGGGATENWSEDANWSGDTEPGTSDLAIFDGTSTKNATIDTAISLGGITMNSGYTGTITQGAGNTLTVGTQNFVTSSGTFTGGDSAITMTGTFTISGGSFTSTTGTLSVAGNWTISSGSFEPTVTGTITATGGTSTWNVLTTETVNNMTVAKNNGASLFISAASGGDTIVVLGTLTLTDGYLETGTIDTRGNTTQGINFDGWDTIIDFGDDAVAQTYTINGGVGPQIRLDSAADANDSIVYNAPATIRGFITTSGFSGTVPIANAGNHTMTFVNWTQNGGTFNGSSFSNMVLTGSAFTIGSGAIFNAPTTITTSSTGTTWDINSSQTVNNLTISHTVGFTLGTNDIIVTDGTLTLNGGSLNTGTVNANGNVVQNSGSAAGSTTVNFNNDSAGQTYTINGGTGPNLRLDSASDANDSIVFAAAGRLNSLTTTSGFSGTIPISNPSNFAMSFSNWSQSGGDYTNNYCSGLCSTMNLGSGTSTFTIASPATFTAPATVSVSATGMTFDVNSSQTFNNLSTSTTVALTISSGDTIVTDGTLTLTNGQLNGGTLNANGNVVQSAGSGAGSTVLNFANNSAVQTYTINGGIGPVVTLDSAADASDSIIWAAAGGLYGFNATSGFSGTIPITNSGNFAMSFRDWTQNAGTFNGALFNSMEITSNGTVTIGPSATFNAPITITNTGAGTTWNVTGTQILNNFIANVIVQVVITAGDTLLTTGTLTLTAGQINTGNMEAQGNVTQTGGSISSPLAFTGSNTQIVTLTTIGSIDGDVTVNKTGGQVNMANALVLNAASQDLTLVEGTFAIKGFALTVNGTSGTFVVQDGGVFERYGAETLTLNASNPTLQTGSTVRYTGDGDAASDTYTITTMASTYSNLSITSTDGVTDTFQLGAALDVNGNLSNTGTLTVTGSNHQVNVAGNWTNTGTFSANSGTVILDGTNQTISGTTTFNNLTKNVTSAATLTLPATNTQTIAGTMTLQGAAGQLLSLRSSSTGVRSLVDPLGTRTVQYLDVKDQNNTNSTAISCGATCVNSGNNLRWFGAESSGTSGYIPPQPHRITLTFPNGGNSFIAGETALITWTTTGSAITQVDLSISRDGGLQYKSIVAAEVNDGSYSWVVTGPATTNGIIRLEASDSTSLISTDTSDAPFTIIAVGTQAPPVTDPSGSTTPPVGQIELYDGKLVKLATSSTVYMLTEGDVLRPFFNPIIFHLYAVDFSQVKTISLLEFNSHVLGPMMLPKPGTVLVKVQESARVYALQDNPAAPRVPIIRWIANETVAQGIYGSRWADYVIDVHPTILAAFVLGADITSLEDTDIGSLRTRFELVVKQRLLRLHQ